MQEAAQLADETRLYWYLTLPILIFFISTPSLISPLEHVLAGTVKEFNEMR